MSNQEIDYRLVAESLQSYGAEADFTDEEIEEILDGYFLKLDFLEADALVFHGGPATEEEKKRVELYENVARMYESNDRAPELVIPDDKTELFSDEILEEAKLIDPDSTEDDVIITSGYENTVHVTSDYHQEGVDWLLNQYDDRDYLVLGARTGNEDLSHWPLVGGSYGSKAASELKEAGRKLLGARFD